MMCIISKTIYLSSFFSLVYPTASFALLKPAYASLVDTSQNQPLESEPLALGSVIPNYKADFLQQQTAASLQRSVSSPFIKLAAVHFINQHNLAFRANDSGSLEFLPEDLCKQDGYIHQDCPMGYIKGEKCPYDSKLVKDCINPETWCRKNGYTVTSCSVPSYLAQPCPHQPSLFKSCETDNIRACKEAGYHLTCDAGKVGDNAQVCSYNASYKKCICNPCSGYDYSSAQASAQGYVPGEVCNSCGTMKYKRTENACYGFKTCDCGGESGAKVCYSGAVKKFDNCKSCCDAKFRYDSSNCSDGKVLAGNSCGGKFEICKSSLAQAGDFLYDDLTTGNSFVNGKTIIGVVVDGAKNLAVALKDLGQYAWYANTYIDVPTLPGMDESYQYYAVEHVLDGEKNTRIVYNYCKANQHSCPAFEAVAQYKTKGTVPGDWFLPSTGEFFLLKNNYNKIEAALQSAGNSLADNGSYWTSNKRNPSEDIHTAYGIFTKYIREDPCAGVGGCFVNPNTKDFQSYVRPMIHYGLSCPLGFVINTAGNACQQRAPQNGDTLYADLTYSESRDIYKTPIGYVLDAEDRIAAALENISGLWAVEDVTLPQELVRESEADAIADMEGAAHTKAVLMSCGSDCSVKFPLFAAVADFNPGGETKGKWFIPSLGQIKKYSENKVLPPCPKCQLFYKGGISGYESFSSTVGKTDENTYAGSSFAEIVTPGALCLWQGGKGYNIHNQLQSFHYCRVGPIDIISKTWNSFSSVTVTPLIYF